MASTNGENNPHGQLGLWDTISIIIGIVIGTSIFTTPPTIFENVAGPWEGLGVWLVCGILSLIGAICYAELATTYPRSGGDYVYLTRGFDRPIGFLFDWAQLAVILSASTGAMAFIFGEYCVKLLDTQSGPEWLRFVAPAEAADFAWQAAIGAVVVLSLMNFFGVVLGKWVQNLLVLVKLVGLILIVAGGLYAAADDPFHVTNAARGGGGVGLAFILVLYAYGGWNDAAFVAADMRRRSDIPKALILGTLAITVIYLLVNLAYIVGLGFDDARHFRPTIAADILTKAVAKMFGPEHGYIGGKVISAIVMISALGAMNGLIFTGSRVYLSLGKEHTIFGILGYWNKMLRAPIFAIVAQALVSASMILVVGTQQGRDGVNDAIARFNEFTATDYIDPIPWGQYFGGFNTLFAGSAPVFWIFFLLSGLSFFSLRGRDPSLARPFMLRAPFYPVLPMIFCGMCLFGFMSAMSYARWISLLGFIPLFVGLPLYLVSGHRDANQVAVDPVNED
jgi:basic amino acid/polyamine antiporter, APA family